MPNPHWLNHILTVPVFNGIVVNAPGIPARGFFNMSGSAQQKKGRAVIALPIYSR
jgi:hypothetical protein